MLKVVGDAGTAHEESKLARVPLTAIILSFALNLAAMVPMALVPAETATPDERFMGAVVGFMDQAEL
jgi:hypothetical protein